MTSAQFFRGMHFRRPLPVLRRQATASRARTSASPRSTVFCMIARSDHGGGPGRPVCTDWPSRP
eukprot:11535824-Alexandrium_andersonii.AAC.1